jgi:hypothetical protein
MRKETILFAIFIWVDIDNVIIQGISRVIIMSPTELKMQPTIHLQSQRGYLLFDFKNIKYSKLCENLDVNRLVKCNCEKTKYFWENVLTA